MNPLTTGDVLKEAELAVRNAQEVRVYHRKRTAPDNQQRVNDLTFALERVKEAMKPLRSERGKFPHLPETPANNERNEKVIAASEALQKERRKLWKMLNSKRKDA